LLPMAIAEELPDEELRGVLRHELAHYRNRDGFWTLFFRTLTALLWFHPLAWKALARYETAAEWCCDEFAYLPNTGVPAKCGSALLAKTFLVIHQNTESLSLNLSTFARFNPVERVARLVRSETLGKETLMKKLLILGLLGLLFIGGTLHIQLVAQPSKTAAENTVIPAQAGIQTEDVNINSLDSRLRGSDEKGDGATFPLTFQSAEELAEFLKTRTAPTTSSDRFVIFKVANIDAASLYSTLIHLLPSKDDTIQCAVDIQTNSIIFKGSPEDLKTIGVLVRSLDKKLGSKESDQQKLKILVLAVHNHHDAQGNLPSSSTAEDGTGKPLHSWRVALLPYLEQIELFEKIRHDEPWDSEYNKQFHTQMPDCYRSPYLSEEQAKKGLTPYVVIVGTCEKGKHRKLSRMNSLCQR